MDGFHLTDLANKNNICLRCGAVEPFAASGLSVELLDAMDDFRKRHEDCPIAGEACLTGAKDTMQYAVKVSMPTVNVDGESFDMGGIHHSGEDERPDDTRDLAIRTALNGAL